MCNSTLMLTASKRPVHRLTLLMLAPPPMQPQKYNSGTVPSFHSFHSITLNPLYIDTFS
jgi:hypothetical protein